MRTRVRAAPRQRSAAVHAWARWHTGMVQSRCLGHNCMLHMCCTRHARVCCTHAVRAHACVCVRDTGMLQVSRRCMLHVTCKHLGSRCKWHVERPHTCCICRAMCAACMWHIGKYTHGTMDCRRTEEYVGIYRACCMHAACTSHAASVSHVANRYLVGKGGERTDDGATWHRCRHNKRAAMFGMPIWLVW